jgi:hypothetical protein
MPAIDAYKGLTVEPKKSVTIELIFNQLPVGKDHWKLLKLQAFSAIQYVRFFKRWSQAEILIKNLSN